MPAGHALLPVQELRLPIALVTVDSPYVLPACRVVATEVESTTAYSAGTTITVGTAGAPALLAAATDNNPIVALPYVSSLRDVAFTAAAVRATIAGAPAAGAGFVVVRFVEDGSP